MKYFVLVFIAAMIGCASFGTVVYSPDNESLNAIEDAKMNCKTAAILGQQTMKAAT